ncbi:hypothetical protein Mgra_00000134 [Meloidogyne graminicola]|uniref:Stress-activated protein kinase JNK n=1 Tax=Meloidogyne graminicola TaxID=189291 RepID=A0A8T0A4R9_9BILA|nr:hypothetical protein Mgra_00000134 [Meloidogyne graminicola]
MAQFFSSQFITFGTSVKYHFNTLFGSVQQWLGGKTDLYSADCQDLSTTSANHFLSGSLTTEENISADMNLQNGQQNNGESLLNVSDHLYHDFVINDISIRILKRYTDLSLVGKGAQGIVLSAYDLVSKQRVVCFVRLSILNLLRLSRSLLHLFKFHHKLLMQNEVDDFSKLVKLLFLAYREFEIMNLTDHPNIIRLINAFTPQTSLQSFNDIYLVMELMNASLTHVTHMDLDHQRLSFLLYQMLCGMNYMHKAGIIHRDLKPSNIAVNYQCRLKILDFGLARDLPIEDIRMTPYVVTRYYRAPEVILGMGYTQNVDVWSIGCIFAELLTGQVIFQGKDFADQWRQIVKVLGTPGTDFTSTLPPDIRSYIESFPFYPTRDGKELFPDRIFPPPLTDPFNAENARDLLMRMLEINPRDRISVSEALKFPYVNCWYDPNEVDCPPPPAYNEPNHSENLTIQDWKALLFQQIKEYENSHDIFGIQNNSESIEMIDIDAN